MIRSLALDYDKIDFMIMFHALNLTGQMGALAYGYMNLFTTLELIKRGRTLIEEKKNESLFLYDTGEETNMRMVLGNMRCGRCCFISNYVRIMFPYLNIQEDYLEILHGSLNFDFIVVN